MTNGEAPAEALVRAVDVERVYQVGVNRSMPCAGLA